MGNLRNIRDRLTRPLDSVRVLEGVSQRLLVFVALIAIALVDARPNKAEEQALVEVGQRLCEASVNGIPTDPSRPLPQEVQSAHLTGLIEHLPYRLQTLRRSFSEGCIVRFWRGRLEPDNDTDYVLKLSASNGDWLILNVKARRFYPPIVFDVINAGAAWVICDPC